MPRGKPNLTITIHRPHFPYTVLHVPERTATSDKKAHSSVKQTFLLSPTPTKKSFFPDSPLLLCPCGQDTPTPLSTLLSSQSSLAASSNQHTPNTPATSPPVVSLADILPDDMDLYFDDEPLSPLDSPTVLSSHHEPIVEQNLILGPEVKRQLPMINEHDFPYYPLPANPEPPSQTIPVEKTARLEHAAKPPERTGTGRFGLRKLLACVFCKYRAKRI